MADSSVQVGDFGQNAGAQALGTTAAMRVGLGVVGNLGGALCILSGLDLGVDSFPSF
ncbi:hypothetical protein D3C87_1848700 [compost metagenome]